MHDRRIDGEAVTFGNAGGLYMLAMTWYDHKTSSIWSQPIGQAISGPLKGTALTLLPSQVTTWANWKTRYPETLALGNDTERLTPFRQRFDPDFVIGLVLAEQAKAYYYADLVGEGIVNDQMGSFPVVVWAGEEDFRAFLRTVEEQVLTFELVGDQVVDKETGTTWDIHRGLALVGPLRGKGLQPVPSLTSYDWAWVDFYPDSVFYGE